MEFIKGYITNLGKYNEGELVGEWVTFPIDEDEETEIRKRIGLYYEDEDGNEHNEQYEEYFFTDWDNGIDLGEYRTIDELNEMAEEIEDIDEDLLNNAIELFSIEDIIEHHEDMILYDWHDDYDIGDYYVNWSGIYDTKNMGALANYIDYEAFGRDIRFDMTGGFTTDGFVEWC